MGDWAALRQRSLSPHQLRLRREYRRTLAWGLLLSAGLHVGGVPLIGHLRIPGLPSTAVHDWPFTTFELPPAVRIPEPPEGIDRPALPLARPVAIESDFRIDGSGVGGADARVQLPPVSMPEEETASFVRYDVPPLLGNLKEFGRIVWTYYPLELQRAGVEGAVGLVLFIDEAGRVGRVRVEESSGYATLDEAAREIAYRLEFLPALMRDQLVGVWVHQRICFVLPKRAASMTPAAAAMRKVTVAGCESVPVRR